MANPLINSVDAVLVAYIYHGSKSFYIIKYKNQRI